jgi:uncharacterized protein
VNFVSPPFSAVLFESLLALNNAHAAELSYKTAEAFRDLIGASHVTLAEPTGMALLVAFSEASTYDNPNFAWLKKRYQRFVYVDRVVVSAAARGQGLARQLYAALENRAAADKRERLVCEINLEPPNPASDQFHEALGFSPVGSQVLPGGAKTVRYWAKELRREP